jgi:hypothetical protein
MNGPDRPTAGEVLAAHLTAALAEERVSKASLEARGLSLVTTSGAFVTLVLAIAALVGDRPLNGLARTMLVLASVGFLVAAVAGVLTNRPMDNDEPKPASMLSLVEEHYGKPDGLGVRAVARDQASTLVASRSNNDRKATCLRVGVWAQVAAMTLVAVAGIAVLTG